MSTLFFLLSLLATPVDPVSDVPKTEAVCLGKYCASCFTSGSFAQCSITDGTTQCYVEIDPDGIFGECGPKTWMAEMPHACINSPVRCGINFLAEREAFTNEIPLAWREATAAAPQDFEDMPLVLLSADLVCWEEDNPIIVEDGYGNPREEPYTTETCCGSDGLCCTLTSGGKYGCDCSGC